MIDFDKKPYVMGIINITPDSFAGEGVLTSCTDEKKMSKDFVDKALSKARLFAQQGADILDIGGESTRPGATFVSLQEELDRVLPVITAIKKELPIYLSIDTTKAEVAQESLCLGAHIINDVSGTTMHSPMIDVMKNHKNAYIILTHALPHLDNPYLKPKKDGLRESNIVEEVMEDLKKKTISGINQGLRKDRIILDPGIGFGKTVLQNMMLLKNVNRICSLGYPVLMGVSRKSFIGLVTGSVVNQRLGGSIAANVLAMWGGANIVRVHDVEETAQAAKLTHALLKMN